MVVFPCVYVSDARAGCRVCVPRRVHLCAWTPVPPPAVSKSVGLNGMGFFPAPERPGRLPGQVELAGPNLRSLSSLSQEDENIAGTF